LRAVVTSDTNQGGMIELMGKRALVTGGGRRLGAEVAATLGAHGMHVAVHFQSSREGALEVCDRIVRAGGRALPLQADLRYRAQARGLVDQALAELGGLDLLVLSAALFEPAGLDADDRVWDDAMALNLRAPWVVAQRAAPALRAAAGAIVLLTCVSRLAPYRGFLPYQVSKAGAHQLMRLLALELAPDVRVNAVAPGSVLLPEGWEGRRVEELLERIPLRRLGAARDVADAVLHLARSPWITGTEIVIDGGRSLT
jgi:pteridine reductase